MGSHLFIVKSHIQLLLPQSVLSSKVADLLNSERFNRLVFIILNNWFQNIQSTSFKPRVAPLEEIKISSHTLVP
jgi:hypothetical protein